MNVVFAGALGRFPVGGHACTELHYMLGLEALGHTVYFLEDCGAESWVYDWENGEITHELEYPTSYIKTCLEPVGLGDRWIYRAGERTAGMDLDAFREICAQADLLLIRSLSIPIWREEYNWPTRRIFIDTDPGFIQIRIENGDEELATTVQKCERLFTIGQQIGSQRNIIPTLGRNWIKTVFPIVLDHWQNNLDRADGHFTSVMQWKSYDDVEYQDMKFGNKDKSFPQFFDLPKLTEQSLQLAFTGDDKIGKMLTGKGWMIVSGWASTFTAELYRQFIKGSKAELGIAKQGYVQMQSGWFSDRSLCYLAAGRPIVVQNTGQHQWLPIGDGVKLFDTMEEARDEIESINENYAHHCKAARQVAEDIFDARKVLPALLEAAMN